MNNQQDREVNIQDENSLTEAMKLVCSLGNSEYAIFSSVYGDYSFNDIKELNLAIDKIKLDVKTLRDKINKPFQEPNYVVYVSGGKTPTRVHTLETAKVEAKRLALAEKKDTFVFKKECMYKIDVKEIKFII